MLSDEVQEECWTKVVQRLLIENVCQGDDHFPVKTSGPISESEFAFEICCGPVIKSMTAIRELSPEIAVTFAAKEHGIVNRFTGAECDYSNLKTAIRDSVNQLRGEYAKQRGSFGPKEIMS